MSGKSVSNNGGAPYPPQEEQRRQDRTARRNRAAAEAAQRWQIKKEQARPASDEILLVSNEERKFVKARLDDGYPQFYGGYGGWEDEPRPGRVSATVFRGTAAPQLKLRLILGRWPVEDEGHNCHRAMGDLDHFARLAIDERGRNRPTLLRISGKVPHHRRRWFIEDLEWGEVEVVKGKRVRAFVTVTLRMYVPIELLARRDRTARRTKPHRVRNGETTSTIALQVLHAKGSREVSRARAAIEDLNGLRTGARLSEGKTIKVPVGDWWNSAARRTARR